MKLKIGIIGTGGIADRGHADGLRQCSATELWSVLSRDAGRAAEFATRHSAQSPSPAHSSLGSFLEDPQLDAVIICTPDRLHAEQAIACARAGKHILLEKPMATDAMGCQAILDACQSAGVTLALGYRLRWHTGHRAVIASAHAGEFGKLRHARVLWSSLAADSSNWRASPQLGRWWSLAAAGTHCLDFARWALCPTAGEIEVVRSITSHSVWHSPFDESAQLAIRFANGATAEIHSSFLFNAPSRFELYGTKGYAICEGTFGREAQGSIRTQSGPVKFEPADPFKLQLDDFARSILEKRKPEVDGIEGMRNTEILLAVARENGF